MPKRLQDMTDDEINERKFTLMQQLCDKNNLPYHPTLVAWLARKGRR